MHIHFNEDHITLDQLLDTLKKDLESLSEDSNCIGQELPDMSLANCHLDLVVL